MSTAEFGNLPREILLVSGKLYMITANIDVMDGLVNGAVGKSSCANDEEVAAQQQDKDELEEEGTDPTAATAAFFLRRLWLQFDLLTTGKLARLRSKHAVNEARRNGYDVECTWIPIEPRSLTVTVDRKSGVACRHRQFPLVQASAITVHKSQGRTYSAVVYEYARNPQKLVYVGDSPWSHEPKLRPCWPTNGACNGRPTRFC